MNGGAGIQQAISNSIYGPNRLRFTQELTDAYRQAYLNSISQAAQQLDPNEAYQLGIVNDANPPQRSRINKAPGTIFRGELVQPQGSITWDSMDEGIQSLLRKAYDRTPKQVKG